MGRTSVITNAFVNGVIPVIYPTEDEVREALAILGLNYADLRCVYCGKAATEWDHLRPLIVGKQPTGYISEIANLVPACGKCNQSKGNKNWKVWMLSNAELSPKSGKVLDIDERIKRLEIYEKWRDIQPINLADLVGQEKWSAYWHSWQQVIDAMQTAQKLADEIKKTISEHHSKREA